jgi:Diguanylate cyclase, GGDEF domain
LIVAARVTALYRTLATQQAELERLNAVLLEDSRRDGLTGLRNSAPRTRISSSWQAAPSATAISSRWRSSTWTTSRRTTTVPVTGRATRSCAPLRAELIRQARSGDAIYRYGGEELRVVFPGQTAVTGQMGAERMRAAIESLAIPHPGLEAEAIVTVSAGVACFEAGDQANVGKLLERADGALYEAKAAGRNRVLAAGAPLPS